MMSTKVSSFPRALLSWRTYGSFFLDCWTSDLLTGSEQGCVTWSWCLRWTWKVQPRSFLERWSNWYRCERPTGVFIWKWETVGIFQLYKHFSFIFFTYKDLSWTIFCTWFPLYCRYRCPRMFHHYASSRWREICFNQDVDGCHLVSSKNLLRLPT